MIVCYVDELREGFFPYVKDVTHLMVPLLKFYFHEEVRRAAVSALPHLVRAAQAAAEKGVPGASKVCYPLTPSHMLCCLPERCPWLT